MVTRKDLPVPSWHRVTRFRGIFTLRRRLMSFRRIVTLPWATTATTAMIVATGGRCLRKTSSAVGSLFTGHSAGISVSFVRRARHWSSGVMGPVTLPLLPRSITATLYPALGILAGYLVVLFTN